MHAGRPPPAASVHVTNKASLCILGMLSLTRSVVSANFGLIDMPYIIGRTKCVSLVCGKTLWKSISYWQSCAVWRRHTTSPGGLASFPGPCPYSGWRPGNEAMEGEHHLPGGLENRRS